MMTKFIEGIDGINILVIILVLELVFIPFWLFILLNLSVTIRIIIKSGLPTVRFLLSLMLLIGLPLYAAMIFENIKNGVNWYESL